MSVIFPPRVNASTFQDPETGEWSRRCAKCTRVKSFDGFPASKSDKAHGKGRYCIMCNRAVSRENYRRRKAEEAPGGKEQEV